MELLIKEVAKRKGFTMAKLAGKTNIDKTTLSRYNTGKVEPPLHKLKIIADVLDSELAELIPVGDKYGHWIDKGEWQGIRKK
ncbi:transcriptional regulator with XRE-family HTH domain [Epilithonimonas hungarica]|uniref:helix-turn-helix domain-containing protein n=1 Tax=Epilithonimonas hungarica TaxID=454006 RepID=UPI00277E3FDF|nr:helix-turn-helix transcriptional regulator [Epilithonimonas hungarica]MDP9954684.1 transcriptional regulator with XRE-family HTH domain [Epilithonimonas hungarica]